MKKKVSKKSEATPIKEVVEQAVEQLTEAVAEAKAQPKKLKVVEFRILTTIMEFATEKAQLLTIHNEAGEVAKFWLSKSLASFIADGDNPEMMICRIPAWLYYKTGLNNFFPEVQWSQVAI